MTNGNSDSRRQAEGRRLPPYSYVSGKHPHPRRDRQGHAYGQSEPVSNPLDPDHWHECEMYRAGIELFNHGYYWEAHEAWEAVWNAHGRRGVVANYVKGLIKLAAAGVKAREGRPEGVARHARRARELLMATQQSLGLTSSQRFAGIEISKIIELCDGLIEHPARIVDTREAAVIVVMPARLELASF